MGVNFPRKLSRWNFRSSKIKENVFNVQLNAHISISRDELLSNTYSSNLWFICFSLLYLFLRGVLPRLICEHSSTTFTGVLGASLAFRVCGMFSVSGMFRASWKSIFNRSGVLSGGPVSADSWLFSSEEVAGKTSWPDTPWPLTSSFEDAEDWELDCNLSITGSPDRIPPNTWMCFDGSSSQSLAFGWHASPLLVCVCVFVGCSSTAILREYRELLCSVSEYVTDLVVESSIVNITCSQPGSFGSCIEISQLFPPWSHSAEWLTGIPIFITPWEFAPPWPRIWLFIELHWIAPEFPTALLFIPEDVARSRVDISALLPALGWRFCSCCEELLSRLDMELDLWNPDRLWGADTEGGAECKINSVSLLSVSLLLLPKSVRIPSQEPF